MRKGELVELLDENLFQQIELGDSKRFKLRQGKCYIDSVRRNRIKGVCECVTVTPSNFEGERALNLQITVHLMEQCPIPAGPFGEDREFSSEISTKVFKRLSNNSEFPEYFTVGSNQQEIEVWIINFGGTLHNNFERNFQNLSKILLGDPRLEICRPYIEDSSIAMDSEEVVTTLDAMNGGPHERYSAGKILSQLKAFRKGHQRWYNF